MFSQYLYCPLILFDLLSINDSPTATKVCHYQALATTSPKMDPLLKEKQAFFEQIDACRTYDEEADALHIEEQALRQKCRAFFAAASVPPRLTKPKSHLRRTASAPVLELANDGLEIIAVTPRDSRPEVTESSPVNGPTVDDSIIPETEQQPNKRPTRRRTHPSTRVLRSQSVFGQVEPSPSISMAKRKRPKPLQMAPESEQIFKGLYFFYIPNDDINPARRLRITKAREHGVTWTQNSAEATHVIVDKELSYDDIKSILDDNLKSASIILVNDRYPLDCLKRRVVFDPNQTVEKYQYQVPGGPTATEELAVPHPPTHDSNASLQLKLRQDAQSTANATPEPTQRSIDLVPSSHPEELQSSKTTTKPIEGATLYADPHRYDAAQAPVFTDELMACIEAVLDDPEKHEYLDESDPDAQASENEGPSNKKRKGAQRTRRNGTNEDFDQAKFMCMRGGIRENKKHSGPNANTIKLLEEMAEEHSLWNETWRVQSYRKAVATLRRQPKKIVTAKEAEALVNIGSSLAGHIEEIVSTGRFQKLEQIRREPSREALKIFCNIYGVGVPTAKRWVELGYRTLDDLQSKAKLSGNQTIGVEHYDDLLIRIPRAEVKALGDYVKEVAAGIDSSVELIIGGSYRRGADSSGDIDLIVTKEGTSSTQELGPFLDTLVDALTKAGFLTAALASHRHDGGNKWHGCCVLPEEAFPGSRDDYRPIWRRVDFLLVPQTEVGAALIYFTGNDLFNRSMRLLARKKKMKLNHKALSGIGVHEGKKERKIFEILGVKWREPHERWC
ncbi:hypothetical protein HD806DRAFT_482455 [Xylariaceae sp. AK1471]|nr:hypothetical protein HD806DRAFT_482455 [Xylariaceae sp. AK1471]